MRILKVWDYEYPWDVRTEKVCSALTHMGHEVHLLARNRRGDALEEVMPEAIVHRMRPWRVLGRQLDAVSQFPAFMNPRWLGLAHRTAKRNDVHLVVVRDLPLAPVAIRVARHLGVPVILDMAEHYAAMIRDLWNTGTTRFGDFLIRNPRLVEMVERWVLERVDHTLVVVEESKARLVAAGVAPESVSVVSNTPTLSRVDEYEAVVRERRRARGTSNNAFSLVYLGVMEEARGVRVVIEAVAKVRQAGVPAVLDLIGDGRSLRAFEACARGLGLSENVVRIHGFVDYATALQTVAEKDVGLIPHHASMGWECTIPNKLFDYMSLGLPVISSRVTPVTRVLEETGAGVTFHDRDSSDLARVIGEMYRNPRRVEMGDRGLHAIRERYNWEHDARLLEVVVAGVLRGWRPD